MLIRLAIRNLFRNRWRSALTVGGIAVAVGMLTWTMAMMDGMMAAFIRGSTAVELGQIQIHDSEYVKRPSIYDHFAESEPMLEAIRGLPRVTGATGRVHAFGLVGHEQRSQVARLVGIDPTTEPTVTLLADSIIDGRWIGAEPPAYPAAREVLLGETLAELLDVGVGAELVVFLQGADGSLGNDLLTVVGVVRTGNSMIDRSSVYMHLHDLQYLTALDGQLHEIAVGVDDYQAAPEVATAVSATVASFDGEDLTVQAWQDILPEMRTLLDVYDKSIWITFLIVFAIVALGILNTMRMSALERRREFGVLKAIGLAPRQLGAMIVAETVVLTLVGAIIGAAGGLALSLYHASHGFDMGAFSDQASFSMMGVAFSERLYFVVYPESVTTPLIWTVVVALLCGLWPALSSARLETTQAISGRAH